MDKILPTSANCHHISLQIYVLLCTEWLPLNKNRNPILLKALDNNHEHGEKFYEILLRETVISVSALNC